MRFATILILFVTVIGGCTAHVAKNEDVMGNICKANGLFDIYKKKKLTFTFHARLPDKIVERSWEWHIKSNKIYLDGEAHSTSGMFVNDIYWLLFPLKAYEDRYKTEVSISRHRKAPMLGEDLTEVVVRYVDGKGYTPNDTYRLYVDDKMMIREWSYLKGGKEPPARMTTWEAYEDIGGIKLSMLREGPAGFRVWFTNVRIE